MRSFVGNYVTRVVDRELDDLLPHLPAILLDGPKGVGKTETALQRAATVRRLDEPAQRSIAEADPAVALEGDPPVLVDEWHRVPTTWDAVRREADEDPAGGRFLLTGSAPLADQQTHSGAGRIATVRMRPLTIAERLDTPTTVSLAELLAASKPPLQGATTLSLRDYADEITRSGFPGLRRLTGRALRTQLDGYLDRIVDRDMQELGYRVKRAATVTAWLRAYAAASATTTSYAKILDAATSGVADKPAKTTVIPYINILTALRILDPVPAWEPSLNRLKRLTQSDKHHLADPALAARLLNVTTDALVRGEEGVVAVPRDGTLLGHLFESLVTLSVRVFAQAAEARVHHLRTRGGRHEVDLIIERGDGGVVAIEVRLSAVVENGDVVHLNWLKDQIGDRLLDAFVINTGPAAYRRPDGIGVVPLALLGA